MQQYKKRRFCGHRDKTINRITSECSRLTQREYKTRGDCVGRMIHCELCKRLKFKHPTKWCINQTESDQENETDKNLWDFKIPTGHLVLASRTDLLIVHKKKRQLAI